MEDALENYEQAMTGDFSKVVKEYFSRIGKRTSRKMSEDERIKRATAGGEARAAALTAKRRKQIADMGVAARRKKKAEREAEARSTDKKQS